MAPDDDHRLRVVGFGEPARRELALTIARVRRGDTLSPVTVVVPSAHAGVTLRRSLAGSQGLLNVQFTSMPQLAEGLAAPLLAAQGRARLTPAVHLAAITAVAGSEPGWLGTAAFTSRTARSLAATFEELGDLPEVSLERLATTGQRGAQVVRLYREVSDRCAGFADRRDLLVAATDAVGADARSLVEIGHVIVHLPRRLGHLEVGLIGALARHGLVTLLVGATGPVGQPVPGEPSTDLVLDQTLSRLEPLLGQPFHVPLADGVAGRSSCSLVRAPDPAEEVRCAVRRVLTTLAKGASADRIAIVTRTTDPYFALLIEQLSAAGIAHHGPSGSRLHQTVAGRVLTGGLDVLADDIPRVGLLRWLRSAPFTQPDGSPLPVDSFERIAREAGISGGHDQWLAKITQARVDLDLTVAKLLTDEVGSGGDADAGSVGDHSSGRVRRLQRRAEHLETLDEVIRWMGEMQLESARAQTWGGLADWSLRFLEALLGPVEHFAQGHPDIDENRLATEVHAYQRVHGLLESLGDVDGLNVPASMDSFREVLTAELDLPAKPVGTFGRGVFVGTVTELVGADHDLVIIVGMAEGIYPPRGVDDPILADRLRLGISPAIMAPRRAPRSTEHRDHLAALASAPNVVCSFARTDTGAQRERMPSRWFLAEVAHRLGPDTAGVVSADDLDELSGRPDVDWWTDIASFAWSMEQPPEEPTGESGDLTMIGRSEATAAEMFRERRFTSRPGEPLGDPLVVVPADRQDLQRGASAVLERHGSGFGHFTGLVGPHPGLVFDEVRVGSATSFETWSTCPFRYYLRHVLDLYGMDERAEADDINPLDRGTYLHEVLESFVGERLDVGDHRVEQRFGPQELERLRSIAVDKGEQFRVQGRTGRPLLWSLRSEQLLRRLEQIFRDDLEHRAKRHVQPVAVELAFGMAPSPGEPGDSVPPVVVHLADGRPLAFRGFIDRVDRSPEGDRLVVIDYKTGSDRGYQELKARDRSSFDIVCRGRHLQLALYGLAAQSAFGPVPVTAFYWFVEQPARTAFRGGDIDELALGRLREVLDIIVEGIEHGRFPARPGEDGYFGFANCGHCDFDRICPSARGDRWEAIKVAPELSRYRALAEGDMPAPVATEATP